MVVDKGRADLHTHTTASDGVCSPSEVVRLAKAAGLSAVAVTDHDTTAGLKEAVEAGLRLGIRVVPGAELSTAAEGIDIHILAYFADPNNDLWQERLASLRDVRDRRNALILEKLSSLGIRLTIEEVRAAAQSPAEAAAAETPQSPSDAAAAETPPGRAAGPAAAGSRSVGRPHIAEALRRKGIVASVGEAFDRFLASGAPAFVSLERAHPAEVIGWIREAGGVSVIAHPGLYGRDSLVEELLRQGACGIEAFHSDHDEADERKYAAMAHRFGVAATGGSDFHGERGGAGYHGSVGARTVPMAVVDRLYRLSAAGREVR